MSTSKEKKRLTLIGSNMPENVYSKLTGYSDKRSLTPYIVELVQKEEMLDKLLESLSSISTLIEKVDKIEFKQEEFYKEFKKGIYHIPQIEQMNESYVEEIKEGRIKTSEELSGGIEEDVEGPDY